MPEEDKKMVPLDTSGPDQEVDIEETKDESVVETEAPKQETETVEQEATEQDDNKLEEYSKGVQSRIAKLTRKMREAERREQAAVEYAKAVEQKRQTLEKQQVASQVGLVMAMGPQCYKDKERYPEGPWCKEKDWIMFARYAGSRIKIDGGEMRLLNDDEVLATIDSPEDILHEF